MSDHIKVSSTTPRVVYAVGATPTQAFAVPFAIPDAGSLRVLVNGTPASLASNPVTAAEFAFTGAEADGGYDNGTVTLGAAVTSATVIVARDIPIARGTDFPYPSQVLHIRELNGDLDRLTMILQQLDLAIGRSIRLSEGDTSALGDLPADRAGKVIGFDGLGRIQLFGEDASNYTAPYAGAVPLGVAERIGEKLTALDFGAVGDTGADVTVRLQNAANAAASSGRLLEIGDGTYRITSTLTVPGGAAGLIMRGRLLYDGPGGQPALVLGDAGAVRNGEKTYWGLRVVRNVQSDWSSEADIGIVARNLDASFVEVRQVEGFTIGLRTLGDQRGFEDTTIVLGRLANNRIGLDIRTATAAGWNNSVRYIGGHFGISSGLNTGSDRFGVRLSAEPGAYLLHNGHLFEGPNFELARTGAVAAIPFLSEVNSRSVIARAMRMEACDAYAARHTLGAQDHSYELAYVGSWAYGVDIDYTGTATRAGSVVQTMHQSAAHTRYSHLLAHTPSLRAAAFRWSATETGFDGLACMAGSPSGSPTTIQGLAFPGLNNFTLHPGHVAPANGRGVGYAIQTGVCRDYALAVDADNARLFVQCFDASGTVLTSGSLVRFSSGSASYNATAKWWQTSADLSDAALNRLTAIRLDPSVAYAIVGVFANGGATVVRALRLFCPPEHAPQVVNGSPFLPAGRAVVEVDHSFDPGSIAAGATAQENVTVADAKPGDFCSVAWSAGTTGMVFAAQVGATDTVTLILWNRTGAPLDLAAGTARVRVEKQRP